MIYVFEGSRNSGKTFLSDHVSKTFSIPKFKFDFSNYFNVDVIDNYKKTSKEQMNWDWNNILDNEWTNNNTNTN